MGMTVHGYGLSIVSSNGPQCSRPIYYLAKLVSCECCKDIVTHLTLLANRKDL